MAKIRKKALSLELNEVALKAREQIKEIAMLKGGTQRLIAKQENEIASRIKYRGVKDFVPDVEVALLMAIKGFHTGKYTYDKDGKVIKVTTEFIPPNYQAAVIFLKQMCPEKYGTMDTSTSNIVNVAMCEADIARLTNVAGSLLQRKAVDSRIVGDNGITDTDNGLSNQGESSADCKELVPANS